MAVLTLINSIQSTHVVGVALWTITCAQSPNWMPCQDGGAPPKDLKSCSSVDS